MHLTGKARFEHRLEGKVVYQPHVWGKSVLGKRKPEKRPHGRDVLGMVEERKEASVAGVEPLRCGASAHEVSDAWGQALWPSS